MAFDWYRTDAAFFRHPKIFELNKALSQERTGWYVHGLWSWLVTYAKRGRFPKSLADEVERACEWRGESGVLVSALMSVGLLDEVDENTFGAHDWDEKQGALAEKAEKDAARKRRERARDRSSKNSRPSADASRAGSVDVTRDGAGTLRDVTGRNGTGRDAVVAPPSAPPIAVAITAPTTPRETWLGDDFWRWAQSVRNAGGYVAEKPPRNLGAWWSAVLAALNGDVDRACEAFEEFGQDKHWEVRNFPFAAFQSQWEKYTPRRAS